MSDVKVRFAPSPSGFLHIGGARTALFNYLFAKKRGGKFIVRIDDTDLTRSSDDSIISILSDLKWLGLDWDHGLDVNTLDNTDDGGPYRASLRKDIYLSHAKVLLDSGKAYSVTDDLGTVIKYRVPKDGDITFFDDIKGKLTVGKDTMNDFVIIRSNGMATYNFATVVDDHLMGITHVYRADEHVANTFKHILLFNAFGWTPPKFGHMALIFGPDNTKLSKRHGATSINDFKNKGYASDALINYLALLGWGHPKGKDIFDLKDLIDVFSIKKVNVSPAMFDIHKLNYINSVYISKMTNIDLKNNFRGLFSKLPGDKIDPFIDLFKTGWITLNDIEKDINTITNFYLKNDGINWIKGSDCFLPILNAIDCNGITLVFINDLLTKYSKKDVMWSLRTILIGTVHGPPIVDLLKLISKDDILKNVLYLKKAGTAF